MIGIICPLTQAVRAEASTYLAAGRLRQFDAARAAPLLIALIILVALVLARSRLHPLWVSVVAPLIFLGLLAIRSSGLKLVGPLNWPYGHALKLGMLSSVGGLVQTSLARIDILVVALLLNQSQAGIYAVALAAAEGVLLAASALAFHALRAGSQHRSETALLLEAVGLTGVLAAVGYAGLHFSARPVLGPEFARLDGTFVVLMPGTLALAVIRIRWAASIGRGRARSAALSMLVGLVVQTVLDVLLVPIFGINGAAVASSIAYIFAAVLMSLPGLFPLDGAPSDGWEIGVRTIPGARSSS